MSRARARLILADDHHLLVEALRAMLSKSFSVVGVAYEGDALLEILRKTDADCLLLDLGMPGRNGLELLPDIRALRPELKVLVVTMHLDRSLADAALQAGAHGFMPKDSGKRYLSPRVPPITNRMSLGAAHVGLAQLTPRQHEILRLIGDGKTTAEMADTLGLSQRTVGFHRTNIRKALGIDSEAGLTRWAVLFRLGEGA